MPGPVVPLPPLLSFLSWGFGVPAVGEVLCPGASESLSRLAANSPRSEGEGALTRVGTMGAAGSEQVLPAVLDSEILTHIVCSPCVHCFSSGPPPSSPHTHKENVLKSLPPIELT